MWISNISRGVWRLAPSVTHFGQLPPLWSRSYVHMNMICKLLSSVWVWLYTGFGLVIGFTELLQNVTTSNYSAIANSHTLHFTVADTNSSQSAVSSPVDTPLLPGSPPRRLAVISHQPPTRITAVSRLLILPTRPRYIVLVRTAQTTLLLTVTPLLRVTQPLPSNSCFSGSTVLALSKYATLYMCTCIKLGFI
jgi:hypothetical protein